MIESAVRNRLDEVGPVWKCMSVLCMHKAVSINMHAQIHKEYVYHNHIEFAHCNFLACSRNC